MKKEDIDQLIEESLNEKEAKFYHQLDEEGLFKQWGGLYKGKLAGWALLISVVNVVIAFVTIWFGYKYFTETDPMLMAKYGGILVVGLIMNGMVKLWHWMQMDKNSILREMKRMEFQIAILSDKVSNKE
jgi:protein-S-isoprenylcysteine O-methyltransferase Ste14